MKKRQSMAGGDKVSEKAKSGSDQMVISGQSSTTRKELAKLANTSEVFAIDGE